MYDQLGDRDYDCFEFDEHEHLKNKISFALYGPPKSVDGYGKREKSNVECLYETICQVGNENSKWEDKIVISFIYNCTEPLPKEKLRRAKKYSDYNASTDINPVPIFVLRKCKGGEEPCRIFIDHECRVYSSWKEYLNNNKLPKCKMIVPKNGRYKGEDNVLLAEHFSPACNISAAVLKGANVASSAVALTSGGVALVALIPTITVAPIALTMAGIAGVGVGIYSVVRSTLTLADRSAHRQSMSFLNSDARGAYINIVAGSLGFVGAGARSAVSTLSARGVYIGQGARILINTIKGANLAVGGIGMANSTFEIIQQILTERQAPSPLSMLQLTSSILFFGNAVYNFKSAETIIEESQIRTLNDIQDSLSSNRYRKTFNNLLDEIMHINGKSKGRAEVIAILRSMNKPVEVMDILSHSNIDLSTFGMRISPRDGHILLSGAGVDTLAYENGPNLQFHLELPSLPESVTDVERIQITSSIQNAFHVEKLEQILIFGVALVGDPLNFKELASRLLCRFTDSIQKGIIEIAHLLICKMEESGIDFASAMMQISTKADGLYNILEFVIRNLQIKVDEIEREYQTRKAEAQQQPNFNEQDFSFQYKINPDAAERTLDFFAKALELFFVNVELTITELLQNFKNWLLRKIYETALALLKRINREKHQIKFKNKQACNICGGYLYVQ